MLKRLFSYISALILVFLSACTIPAPNELDPIGPFNNNSSAAPVVTAPVPTVDSSSASSPDATSDTADTSSGEIKGVITFAFDAFPTYYPGIIIETKGLLKRRGYDLQLIPFGLQEQHYYSQEERYARLRTGEWDVMATTLDSFARNANPEIGAITTLIDESAGADRLVVRPEINTINDLRGKRIAYTEGSVGQFFLYYVLHVAGLTSQDVVLIPRETVSDAVQTYLDGEADAVSAWEPDVLQAEAEGRGKAILTSENLRTIIDVLVSSRQSMSSKPEAVQAFHDAWYEALRLTIDSPSEAGQAIIDWGHPEWTQMSRPEDLQQQLAKIAQATLGANQIAFQSPDVLVSRLQDAQRVWAQAEGDAVQVDFSQMIDGQFALASAQTGLLFPAKAPVNNTFLLTARVQAPALSAEEQQDVQPIARLPLEQVEFESDATRLTPKAIQDLNEQVLPVLRASDLYLQIQGSAAWPGPSGRYSEQEIVQFARERAVMIAMFLTQQGIDPNRLLIDTLPPKFPESQTESELVQDRIVRFTLVGGR